MKALIAIYAASIIIPVIFLIVNRDWFDKIAGIEWKYSCPYTKAYMTWAFVPLLNTFLTLIILYYLVSTTIEIIKIKLK